MNEAVMQAVERGGAVVILAFAVWGLLKLGDKFIESWSANQRATTEANTANQRTITDAIVSAIKTFPDSVARVHARIDEVRLQLSEHGTNDEKRHSEVLEKLTEEGRTIRHAHANAIEVLRKHNAT